MTDPVTLTSRGACCNHTRQRLQERYGITITADEYKALCRALARDWPRLRWKPSDSSGYPRIKVKYPVAGQMVLFVFSPSAALIVTAVPRTPRSKPNRQKGRHQINEDVQRKARSKRPKYQRRSKRQQWRGE